jgi:hypothetical protein
MAGDAFKAALCRFAAKEYQTTTARETHLLGDSAVTEGMKKGSKPLSKLQMELANFTSRCRMRRME